MKRKNLILTSLVLATSLSLSACTTKKDNPVESLKILQIKQSTSENYSFKTLDFNLGEKSINLSSGKKLPYLLRGIMSVPQNSSDEKLKPVFILHGCHDNDNIKRFDTGFKYLTEYLAKNGYLAISLDVNATYDWKFGDSNEYNAMPIVFEEHLNSLKDANSGKKIYDVDLKNKVDFDNMAIIGHSTAGEIIFRIVDDQNKKGVNINTLLAIAPTVNTDTNFNVEVGDVSILAGGLDGDVTDLPGVGIYNSLTDYNKQNIVAATILKNANHNYFNSEVEKNDAQMLGIDLKNQISRENQEEFLQNFTVDFLNASFKKKYGNTIYDIKSPTVNKINGYDAITYLQTSKSKNLVDITKLDNFKATNSVSNIELLKESLSAPLDTAVGAYLPTGKDPYINLLKFKWEDKDTKLSFKPLVSDFSKFDNIEINALVDGSDELNKKNSSQSISVELVDNKGNKQIVKISSDSNLLPYPNGEIENLDLGDKVLSIWNTITPLSNIRIPLSLFEDINLSNITEVNLLFNDTDSGALMFESFIID